MKNYKIIPGNFWELQKEFPGISITKNKGIIALWTGGQETPS